MLAIQYDDRALFLAPWRELLLEILDDGAVAGDAALAEYRALVESWLPRAAPESVGYRLVRAFRIRGASRVFRTLFAPVLAELRRETVPWRVSASSRRRCGPWFRNNPSHLLPTPTSIGMRSWSTRSARIFATTKSVMTSPLAERTWGERNTSRIRHPLSRAVPMLSRLAGHAAAALAGDNDLPKAQAPGFGASERFSVSPGDEANGLMHMPTGQSGHPMSPYYRRGHDNWVRGRAEPVSAGRRTAHADAGPRDAT